MASNSVDVVAVTSKLPPESPELDPVPIEPRGGGALVVIYAADLAAVEAAVAEHGGTVVKEAFEFPGGRRFHFADPSGNQLAVWSEQ